MASLLASLYGTEKDKINCSFYYKIGACRHGSDCSRKHMLPPFSNTILLHSLFNNPRNDAQCTMSDEELQAYYDAFYEDFWIECTLKYGDARNASYGVQDMVICENVAEHLAGNIYVMFATDTEAERASRALNERFFAGRPIYCELSPVSDFREARCRQHEANQCNRGGLCNFMHVKPVTAGVVARLREGARRERAKAIRAGGSPARDRDAADT